MSKKNVNKGQVPDEPDNDETRELSKTALKREAQELQQLGLALAQLSTEQRQSLDLPDRLRAAIDDYIRFPSREAKRRQLQFVGKVMRKIDTEPLRQKLMDIEGHSAEARYTLHQAEHWRDTLIAEPSKVGEFIDAYPSVDRQALRNQLRKMARAKSDARIKTESRALFRLLREVIQA